VVGPGWTARDYERIAERFVEWASSEDAIRAAFVIGSRAREDHAADEWADLDILVATSEASGQFRDPGWVSRIGDPWITFIEPTPAGHGTEWRVLFAGGVDVDFALFTVGEIEGMFRFDPRTAATAFGRGFRVLLDKDGLVARLFDANPPADVEPASPPDAAAFGQVVADFWYHAVWTAKHLRRGELWWAKLGCDGRMKELLRHVLEWEAAAAGRDAWFRGRFFEEWADPVILRGLRTAFARYDEDEIWTALEATMDLFGEVSRRTAAALNVPCPPAVEEHARALVTQLRSTRQAVRQSTEAS
jgi:aminoglycoside 6-adenylyltransferase